METSKPTYDWHINLDRNLQHPTAVVATQKNREIREFVSSALREKLEQEAGEK